MRRRNPCKNPCQTGRKKRLIVGKNGGSRNVGIAGKDIELDATEEQVR